MRNERGVTLIDTLVGSALMLVIFIGVAGAFRLAIDVVINNKARTGAIALANERMEYIHSLAYASIGTSGGIPSGTIPQSETVALNGISYTRRTVIEYADDPKDGVGGADANGIIADYRAVKVDVAWASRNGVRHITLVSRFESPTGMEINCTPPCGNLVLSTVNAGSAALSGASVTIVNPSTMPAVNFNTFSNVSGAVNFIGVPAGSGYQITVTQSGYSTAKTYSATSQNTNPNPGNLTVSNGQTTSGTFAIDVLGSKTVRTWTQILPATSTDAFSDASAIATSSNITISGGTAHLTSGASWGEVQSNAIAPSYLNQWKTLSWTDSKPAGTSIRYRVYDSGGSSLIPESQLPGNSAGFTASPISFLNVSTTTSQGIRLDAVLTTSGTTTPSIDVWNVAYTYGPQPLPSISFTLQGAKTIGSGPSGTIYKYSQTQSSGPSGSVVIPSLEWDTYLVTVNGTSTGYDIASACNPQPEALAPGASMTSDFFLASHTVNSLLVDVRSAATGVLISNATVTLSRTGFSASSGTDGCGQVFFGNLTSSSTYTVVVSAPGYSTKTQTNMNVAGTSRLSITLN